MWFSDIAEVQQPGRQELIKFVDAVLKFLSFVLEHPDDFGFLWEGREELQQLARDTFRRDVVEIGGPELRSAIGEISDEALRSHGLTGRALRFKLKVLDSISSMWGKVKGVAVPGWLKRTIEAIDAILGSLVDAAGGPGGVIKEFKEALAALIP
jgi:hypothetical protein